MQKENDLGQSQFTFRKWNPTQERVMWGSANDSSLDPVCPMTFLCCYLSEIMCFNVTFRETIDHCASGYKNVQQIIGEYNRKQNILFQTNAYRILIALLTIGGCYLVIAPFFTQILWIPEVGYLLKHQTSISAITFSIHCATIMYLAIAALTWIPYRCCLSFFMLAVCGSLVGIMMIGTPMTLADGLTIYR